MVLNKTELMLQMKKGRKYILVSTSIYLGRLKQDWPDPTNEEEEENTHLNPPQSISEDENYLKTPDIKLETL